MSRKPFTPARWLLVGVAGGFALAAVVALAIRPGEPATDSLAQKELRQQLSMDTQAAAIFSHSCADCHSNHTNWPWYSYVPPVSFLVKRDVDKGREDFNVSAWSSYSVATKREILAAVARVVTNGEMPLKQYLLIHRGARLSDADGEVLVRWASQQRRQLAKAFVRSSRIAILPKGNLQ